MTLPSAVLMYTAVPSQTEAMAAAVHALAPDLEIIPWRKDLTDEELQRVQVLFGWVWPRNASGRMPNLRWICCTAAGVDKLLVPGLPEGVPISRIVDPEQALAIAQHVATVVLAHARLLPTYQAQQLQKDWTRHPQAASRQTVGIVGHGAIGGEIGRVLDALGFRVKGWRRSTGPLTAFLSDCQIVVNALPLTADTENLFDAEVFAAMPRSSYFVTIARGQHVVEADLIAALCSGHLAGAALDVQRNEPMPADDPLWTTPGVLITPHIAGQSDHQVVARQFVEGLQALARGEVPPNPVDRMRGY